MIEELISGESNASLSATPDKLFRENPGNKEKIMNSKILLVDDEKHIRSLYKMELEEEGYSVVALTSSFRIIDKIEELKPDIVVLDIKLIDGSGLDVLLAVKDRFENMPVGLCTAYEPFKNDMKSVAADFYVVKSHDLTELKTSIFSILEKQQS